MSDNSQLTATAFHSPELYPQLAVLVENWETIRDESVASLNEMMPVLDNRTRQGSWRALPLKPEEEDAALIPIEKINQAKMLAPFTAGLLDGVDSVKGYAFSALAAHSEIKRHTHSNPYVTAMLCLQCSGESYIVNAGERADFIEGEVVVFDYTLEHEVHNKSDVERIVLLVLLENILC